MVIAIAALLFQFTPVNYALPAVAAVTDESKARVTLAIGVPDMPTRTVSIAAVPMGSSTGQADRLSATSNGGVYVAAAVDTQIENSQPLPPDTLDKKMHFALVEALPSRHRWIGLSVAQHAAAAFDAYTTRDAISHGAFEKDALMRPFANSGAIYAALQVVPAVLDLAARRAQRSESNLLRHTWWLPQSVSTGVFLISGARNLQVAGQ